MKLRIQKAVYGGAGLARIAGEENPGGDDEPSRAGKAVFVPYTLPGELVEAHITEDRHGFSTAELGSIANPAGDSTPDLVSDPILEASAARVTPGCEYFPACGGCQYQHASAAYQLRMKLDILRDTLERAHLDPASLNTIASLSGPPWGYRNRIRLRVAQSKSRLALCYRARGTRSILPVTHCPIAAPLIERAIATVLEIGGESGLGGLCDQIEFFANGEQNALLVSLWTHRPIHQPAHGSSNPSPDEALQEFAARLKSRLPELTGAGLFSAGDRAERLLSHWGQRSLIYTVSGRQYRVSLGSFFQVNRFLLPQLADLVTGGCSGRVAWDLYAGVGLFARALNFEHVTAVEASPFSAEDLKQNLAGTPHRAVRSTTLDFLEGRLPGTQERREAGRKPDLILLDPPRAGLGNKICARLAETAAPEIVYVSCDPATLARDLQALLRSGYRLKDLHLVDLFPQTFHLETFVTLARN